MATVKFEDIFTLELTKTRREKFTKQLNVMAEWASLKSSRTGKISAWASDTLGADINLPTDVSLPLCMTFQVLLVGPRFPVILISLYDPAMDTGPDAGKAVDSYTIHMAKLLKASLMNFSFCDFALLRFAVDQNKLTEKSLEAAFQKELEYTRTYFRGGPIELDITSVAQLKRAVTLLSCTTPIPSFLLEEGSSETWLLELDEEWREVLYLVIEALTDGREHLVLVRPEWTFKFRVAVHEAIRRLSLSQDLVIKPDQEIDYKCAQVTIKTPSAKGRRKDAVDIDIPWVNEVIRTGELSGEQPQPLSQTPVRRSERQSRKTKNGHPQRRWNKRQKLSVNGVIRHTGQLKQTEV